MNLWSNDCWITNDMVDLVDDLNTSLCLWWSLERVPLVFLWFTRGLTARISSILIHCYGLSGSQSSSRRGVNKYLTGTEDLQLWRCSPRQTSTLTSYCRWCPAGCTMTAATTSQVGYPYYSCNDLLDRLHWGSIQSKDFAYQYRDSHDEHDSRETVWSL